MVCDNMTLTDHQKSVINRLYMQIIILPFKKEQAEENIKKIREDEPWIVDWLNGRLDDEEEYNDRGIHGVTGDQKNL